MAFADNKPTMTERDVRRQAMLDTAKIACEKMGGFAWIDKEQRYVVVDTNLFSVAQRDKPLKRK